MWLDWSWFLRQLNEIIEKHRNLLKNTTIIQFINVRKRHLIDGCAWLLTLQNNWWVDGRACDSWEWLHLWKRVNNKTFLNKWQFWSDDKGSRKPISNDPK